MSYIILNLDSTISDDKWRQPMIDLRHEGKLRFHEYHLLAAFDEVVNKQLLNEHDLIIFTGRLAFYKAITIEWLIRAGIVPKIIKFRDNKCNDSPSQLKHNMLQSLFLGHQIKKEDIICAYDDDYAVCQMYRKNGLQSIQVLNMRKDDEDGM